MATAVLILLALFLAGWLWLAWLAHCRLATRRSRANRRLSRRYAGHARIADSRARRRAARGDARGMKRLRKQSGQYRVGAWLMDD